MILGTAGHIDHGKTALVRALTGVDTDRLPEEKRRGITIDLGFAPLRLADNLIVGVVDVPGHEAFVRTMLAGASGIDLALLVIAADEGPMPQTLEHLAILQLLEIPRLAVALTKSDLVDAEWLALVTQEVRELLAASPYADAEVIPTSVAPNAGIETLRETLLRLSQSPKPKAHSPFRLPIDRVFSVRGTGTVATGTVWSGSLAVDDVVRVMPNGVSARVRGIQSHGESLPAATAGTRAAIALAGVDVQAVARGATLVTLPEWEATLIVRADLTLFADAPELRPRTRVRFHLATSDVGARVVAAGSPVAPGSSRPVRIVLDEPVMARAGDRFVLRSASPLATIGGGVITDSNAPRRARPMRSVGLSAAERMTLFADEAGLHGVPDAVLAVRLGAPLSAGATPDAASPSDDALTRIGDRWFAAGNVAAAKDRLVALVTSHHAANPLATGVSRQDVRSRLGVDGHLFDHLVAALVAERRLDAAGAELRLAGRAPELSESQSRVSEDLLIALESAGSEPPSVAELQTRFGTQTVSLLRHLERQQRVVQVEDVRFYAPAAVRELLRRLEAGMAGKGPQAPTDLREMLGFSRKFLIPFLEYCDKRGYTLRQGNGRVWRGVTST